jgi:predicted amidohydrolase
MSDRITKVALAQVTCKAGDKATNFKKAEDIVKNARNNGAKLVVFPELFLSGFALSDMSEVFNLAETIPGPLSNSLVNMARKYDVYMVIGMPVESPRMPGIVRNGAVFVGPNGVIGTYFKTHVATGHLTTCPGLVAAEHAYYKAGDEFFVWDTPIGRLGICTCYDIFFPEVPRILTLKGAEIIVVPAASDVKFVDTITRGVSNTASMNNVFCVFTNFVGIQDWPDLVFFGKAMAYDPSGNELAAGSVCRSKVADDEIVYASLDLDQIKTARTPGLLPLRDRRPEIYGDLCKPGLY